MLLTRLFYSYLSTLHFIATFLRHNQINNRLDYSRVPVCLGLAISTVIYSTLNNNITNQR